MTIRFQGAYWVVSGSATPADVTTVATVDLIRDFVVLAGPYTYLQPALDKDREIHSRH